MASLRIQDTSKVFAIYSSECDRKDDMFLGFLLRASEAIGLGAEFSIIEGPIDAGPETILVYGAHWRDGESPDYLN